MNPKAENICFSLFTFTFFFLPPGPPPLSHLGQNSISCGLKPTVYSMYFTYSRMLQVPIHRNQKRSALVHMIRGTGEPRKGIQDPMTSGLKKKVQDPGSGIGEVDHSSTTLDLMGR